MRPQAAAAALRRAASASSPRRAGAAMRDVLSVLARRFPCRIVISARARAGRGRAGDIVRAMRRAHRAARLRRASCSRAAAVRSKTCGRSTTSASRARSPRAACRWSPRSATRPTSRLADFVADLRAPTPSAAAELLVPSRHDLRCACRDCNAARRAWIEQSRALATRNAPIVPPCACMPCARGRDWSCCAGGRPKHNVASNTHSASNLERLQARMRHCRRGVAHDGAQAAHRPAPSTPGSAASRARMPRWRGRLRHDQVASARAGPFAGSSQPAGHRGPRLRDPPARRRPRHPRRARCAGRATRAGRLGDGTLPLRVIEPED